MQTTTVSDMQNHDLVEGKLMLPSVNKHGEWFVIDDITLTEALDLVENFDERIQANKKIKNYPDHSTPSIGYLLFNTIDKNITDAGVKELFETLRVSNIPQWRGNRAVFISHALSVAMVGRTVVYNQNWASTDVLDPSLQDVIHDVVLRNPL